MEENNNIIKIKAKCNSIIFPRGGFNKNSENMYGIVSWDVSEEILGEPILHPKYGTVTITGQYEAGVEYCTEYTIIAKEVENPKYGKQYQLIQYGEQYNLDSTRDQKAFLRTILTYNQVKEIYKVTDDPIKTIAAHDRKTLKKAKGIGDYIVDRIIKRYEENKDYTELYIELDEYGLTPNFIQKLIKEYKNPKKVIETVKKNPYKLCYDVDGVGFRTADNIAIKVGLDEKSTDRVAAFVQWKLDELGKSGCSYISTDKLTDLIYEEFGGKENILEVYRDKDGSITGSNIGKAISQLVLNKVIGVDPPQKQNRCVWLIKYYELEKAIARELKRLMCAKNKFKFSDWENKVSAMEEKQGWKFTDEQKAGIKLGLDSNVCVITGGGGSGKSSTLSGMLSALGCYDGKYSFAQSSLSGKAAARMAEVTKEEGMTTHRLLGFKPGEGFSYNRKKQLTEDIIIIDEISLYGGELFLALLEAIRTGSKLIMLGDDGQLESIGSLNLAHDMIESPNIPLVKLTKIHRQAAKSGVITSSLRIRDEHKQLFKRNFEGIKTIGELEDMHFNITSDSESTKERVVNTFKEKFKSPLVHRDIMRIQVLCTMTERGDASVLSINRAIQEFYNPESNDKKYIIMNKGKNNEFTIREGDKIMCVQNSYRMHTSTNPEEDVLTDVYNGWIGIAKDIDPFTREVYVYFPIIDKTVIFDSGDINTLTLAYACTTHKYQGSSAPCVIAAIDASTPPQMRTREMIYTMLTRAEKDCTLVGQNYIICECIATSGVKRKNTFLQQFLLDK